ncbi:ATP-binding cassette domain-containing protein [Qingshengfaniella alkalisoli]|uniref:ATP-binding cassette domain-containing protein n=1 Tax=Qingshengfaniella alkalisoli TaxID=2599296 RepID=A0A5B8I8W7_9RHOB|nr:ATP-binding cassette domain-containing protein [Qingshengfaniella alkalisoli]QDY69256.1 ATP-binding cassette domain-containing protein [Qingshengfaniella alkalisoli]
MDSSGQERLALALRRAKERSAGSPVAPNISPEKIREAVKGPGIRPLEDRTAPKRRRTIARMRVEELQIAGHQALSFTVGRNDCTALLGDTDGLGRDILRCVMGLEQPAAGRVLWDGTQLRARARFTTIRRWFAYIPRGGGVFDDLTVDENLRLARLSAGRGRNGVLPEGTAFNRLGGFDGAASGLPPFERLLLAIAIATLREPELVVLDDPLSNLPVETRPEMSALIADHWGGSTSLLITENTAELAMKLDAENILLDAKTRAREGPIH